MTDVVEQGGDWNCTSAEDFLDKLSLRKPQWRPHPGAWLFRGQPGEFDLRPKAYRENGKLFRELDVQCFIKPGETKPTPSAYRTSFTQLMVRFRGHLDSAGLSIPAPAPDLFERVGQTEPTGRLSEQATPLVALAQHVGLPTPLLDWTTRPFIAAYFALPAVPSDHTPLVVWALRQDMIVIGYELEEVGFDYKQALLKVETAPRASNPNLHAQSGLFTIIDGPMASEYTVDGYMTAVANAFSRGTLLPNFPFMRKLTLPGRYARKLQQLLVEEGITGSSMFPGLEGVVRSMKERAVWSKAQRL